MLLANTAGDRLQESGVATRAVHGDVPTTGRDDGAEGRVSQVHERELHHPQVIN